MNFVMKIRVPIFLVPVVFSLFLGACETGIYHTVKPGQTLYRISRTYGVNEGYLARVNGIYDPSRMRIGTRLYVPGADRVLQVPVVKSKKTVKLVTFPPKKKTAIVSQRRARLEKPALSISKHQPLTKKATQIKKFRWPVRGKIVRSFSKKIKAGGGKGIEIAVQAGSDVTAAAAGKVIYSGDGVHGYAFLIILQHENELFTVYGFNQKNLVGQGDFVSQGEKIALSGIPPAGGKPRLHFEVRKGKLAVNPLLYLP